MIAVTSEKRIIKKKKEKKKKTSENRIPVQTIEVTPSPTV